MRRKATAVWNGTGLEGSGNLTSVSGVLNKTPYSFSARFKNEEGTEGTNPEELIAAAHAGCYSMALSFQLANANFVATEIKTNATVTIEKLEAGFEITGIHLDLEASIPEITEEQFLELANAAKSGCPVSKALSSVPITLTAKLK